MEPHSDSGGVAPLLVAPLFRAIAYLTCYTIAGRPTQFSYVEFLV
jgi:hypothetical protein